jgi:glycosyltransferase
MKISIITVTKNSLNVIERNILSIINQNFISYEHIIINKKGSEDLYELVRKYPNIKYICLDDDGIFDAMDYGLSVANGDYIAFLNSDDFYIDKNLFNEISKLTSSMDLDCIYGDIQYCTDSKLVRMWKSGIKPNNFLRYSWMPPHPSSFYKRCLLNSVGGFNKKMKISSDFELYLKCINFNSTMQFYNLEKLTTIVMPHGISSSRYNAFKEDVKSLRKFTNYPIAYAILKRLLKIRQFFILRTFS